MSYMKVSFKIIGCMALEGGFVTLVIIMLGGSKMECHMDMGNVWIKMVHLGMDFSTTRTLLKIRVCSLMTTRGSWSNFRKKIIFLNSKM
jgi:hypothetical protein